MDITHVAELGQRLSALHKASRNATNNGRDALADKFNEKQEEVIAQIDAIVDAAGMRWVTSIDADQNVMVVLRAK